MKEKRKEKRYGVLVKVDYRDIDKFFTDFAENLSKGGMFIATSRPLPVGSFIFLEFSLPDRSLVVKTKGEVVWVRKTPGSPKEKRGMGVKFEDLSKEDKEKIDKLIQRLRSSNAEEEE